MAACRALLVGVLASLVPVLALAAPGDPTEEEMVKALAPRPAQAAPAPEARPGDPAEAEEAEPAGEAKPGIRLRGRKAVTAKAARDATEGAREGRLQLSVQFDLGSAVIAEEGRALLARLGRAMASPALAGLAYRIEGHTDATGGPAINQRLSERRAESVTAFLITATGLSEDRFVPVGFGSSQPLDPSNPEAAVNRRVVVVSLERAGGIAVPSAAAPKPAPSPKPVPAAPATAVASPAAAAPVVPPAPAPAITLGEGGRLQHVKGSLEVQKPSGAGRTEVGARVEEGDVLTTGPGASALVQFDDGANVLIRPDSSVKLAKLKHSGDSLGQVVQVITGACRYVTGAVGRARPETVAIATPTATVGIRGTDLEVVYREGADAGVAPGTYVRVNDGGVTVGGLDGTRVELGKGEKAYAGRPGSGLRGQLAGPAVKRVDDATGVFASGDLDALIGSK